MEFPVDVHVGDFDSLEEANVVTRSTKKMRENFLSIEKVLVISLS